jgi:ATP-dependent Clp endopeptidase proteolytic subunit ClpP
MKNWYSINAKAGEKTAEISIYDEIGFWGVTAKDFITDLKKIDASEITLFINSPGGSVFDGLAIYNAIRQHPANVTVKVMGVAASAASFIAMAGDKIVMPENTFMMVHNPMGGVFGNADEMREWADTLDKIAASLIAIYVARTGKTEDEVKALLNAETWMTAKEAVDLGFADTVEAEMKIAAAFEIERLPENIKTAFNKAKEPVAEPKTVAPLAQQIVDLATKAGLPEYADIWALRCADVETVLQKIAEASEIKALCAVAKAEDKAPWFIRSGTPLAKVREALITARAEQDEKTHTSNVRSSTESAPTTQQGAAFTTEDIYAARRKAIR